MPPTNQQPITDNSTETFRVSVVIPVFNCERFLRRAVESAVVQPETDEVVLIWDASPDNALAVCEALASEHPGKVRVFKHPDGKNHGAGASRNLGIREARNEWIAFLDADDFYLPRRFSCLVESLKSDPTLDGMCEAVGTHFEDDALRHRWEAENRPLLTTLRKACTPEELFVNQDPVGMFGWCQTSGWVVRRALLEKTGLFNERMERNEDLLIFAQFAGCGRIQPGRLEKPVAMRRVHAKNLTAHAWPAKAIFLSRLSMWKNLYSWGKTYLSEERQKVLFSRIIEFNSVPWLTMGHWRLKYLAPPCQMVLLILHLPCMTIKMTFWRKLCVVLIVSIRKTFIANFRWSRRKSQLILERGEKFYD